MTDETNSSGLRAGDKLQMSSGAQFQVTRIEGPFIFLREVLNGDLVGPELQKTAGDLIYLGAPVQEKDDSLHEITNRMFMRKEELDGLEQDEAWLRKVEADAAKQFMDGEDTPILAGLDAEMRRMENSGLFQSDFDRDIAYLRKQIFAGLGIPDAGIFGRPYSDMAEIAVIEEADWLERTLRKILSEKMLMRVDRLLRQHTLMKEAAQTRREFYAKTGPTMVDCPKHGRQPIDFLQDHAGCRECVKSEKWLRDVLRNETTNGMPKKFATEYLGQFMEEPEEPEEVEDRFKYAPGKTPVSTVLGITEGPNKNGDEFPVFGRTVGSIPLDKVVVHKDNLKRVLEGGVSMGCSVGAPWCPLCQRSGDDMPCEHVKKLGDGTRYVAGKPKYIGKPIMDSGALHVIPRSESEHKIGFMVTERNGVPVFWPKGEGELQSVKEGEELKEGDEIWVPDLCGRGYMPMKIFYGSQGLTAKGERLTAALRYEDGELLCSCLMNLDAVKKLELTKEEDDG